MELRPVLICLVLALAPAGVCLTRLLVPPNAVTPGPGAAVLQRVSTPRTLGVWSRSEFR